MLVDVADRVVVALHEAQVFVFGGEVGGAVLSQRVQGGEDFLPVAGLRQLLRQALQFGVVPVQARVAQGEGGFGVHGLKSTRAASLRV